MTDLTCRELVRFLDGYLAGELPAAQHSAFDKHLRLCPDCASYLATYTHAVRAARAALGASGDAPPPEVPRRLIEAVLAARRTPR